MIRRIRNILKYIGPGLLVTVGFMDYRTPFSIGNPLVRQPFICPSSA